MRSVAISALLTLVIASPATAEGSKPRKPQLDLKAVPRFAFSPANVLFTAELVGGDDVEELHCPEVEWDWGDGGKSVKEGDCPPFEPGQAIERRFTAEHEFKRAGNYSVKVTLRRANRSLAAQSVRVTVRPGLGDRTVE